jgi:hypothetical protein
MESSHWIEEVVHPSTGEKRLFQADTEEQLEALIAAWTHDDTVERAPANRVSQASW